MRKILSKLKIEYKVALFSTFALAAIMLISIFCYFRGWGEIPNGIALGGVLGILSYVMLGLTNKSEESDKLVGTIIITILRYVIFAVILFVTAWLYYKLKIQIFNLFAIVGGYLLSLIVFIILTLIGKEKNGSI